MRVLLSDDAGNSMRRTESQNVFRFLREIDEGILQHTRWMKKIHHALICDEIPIPAQELREDAHLNCEFGQWFSNINHENVLRDPLFQKIEELHRQLHQNTAVLLQERKSHSVITTEDYDNFIEATIEFKSAVRKLQFQLIQDVCAVDHLTGAWNRQTMYYRLMEEHERFIRSRMPCAIAMVDIDHFKKVNDTYGHTSGDEVLKKVSSLLSESLRRYDAIFRYGGEEFLVCMPGTETDNAHQLLNRIRKDLETTPIQIGDSREIFITASFGVAWMEKDKEIDETVDQADRALLCAKSQGRNQVCLWEAHP